MSAAVQMRLSFLQLSGCGLSSEFYVWQTQSHEMTLSLHVCMYGYGTRRPLNTGNSTVHCVANVLQDKLTKFESVARSGSMEALRLHGAAASISCP
jgi:hypothetical protein